MWDIGYVDNLYITAQTEKGEPAMDKNLVQGSMGMMIMRLLEEKDMYGYEMIEVLRSRSNQVFELKAGTLYPLLHSLEEKGYLTSYEQEVGGKKRKYYQLTSSGKKKVSQKKEEWQTYQAAVSSVLSMQRGAFRLAGESD